MTEFLFALLFAFLFMAFLIFIIFVNYKMYCRKCVKEERILKDPNSSEEAKRKIRHQRYMERKSQNAMLEKSNVIRTTQICKFENVYRTYKDTNLDLKKLVLYDSYVSYENNTGISLFAISYDDIIDAKCDTTENLTAMRFIALGVLAFAFKKKTYYTIITYKDDLTNSDQQLIFRVDNPINKDEFINNLLIKRNQYLLNKKQPI